MLCDLRACFATFAFKPFLDSLMALADRASIKAALLQLLTGAIAANFTANATQGSPVLSNVSSLTGLFVGLPAGGSWFPPGTFIVSLAPQGDMVTLSEPALATSPAAATFATGFQTTGDRLRWYTEVSAQPALFVRHSGDEYPPRRTAREIPSAPIVEFEAWIYSNAGRDPDVAPGTALDNLIDAVRAALTPVPGLPQTLGLPGIVQHCWIEGHIDLEPGDAGGQAIAVIPIKVLAPGI